MITATFPWRVYYEAAVQIEPAFSLVYFNLALVYHRVNNVNRPGCGTGSVSRTGARAKTSALDELFKSKGRSGPSTR